MAQGVGAEIVRCSGVGRVHRITDAVQHVVVPSALCEYRISGHVPGSSIPTLHVAVGDGDGPPAVNLGVVSPHDAVRHVQRTGIPVDPVVVVVGHGAVH